MGFMEYFGFRDPERVEDRTITLDDQSPGLMLYSPAGTVTPHNALELADVWACIRALADAAASLPLHIYRRTPDGRQRLDNQTAALLERPAPAATTANLVGQLVCHLQTHGNAFVAKYRQAGRIEQLGLLAPDRVQVAVEAGRPVYTVTHTSGGQTRHGVDDVVHVKALSTDGLVGLSPVRQCRVALGLAGQLADHATGLLANDATPRGVLKLQRFGDVDAQLAELRTAFETVHKGPENAGKVAVIAGEIDFAALGLPPEDLQFIEQRKLSAVEVARIFRVPPWIVGADSGESLTYSNTEQQSLHFATYSLRPWLVLIEQALSADADLFTSGTYCEFSLDALLRSDSKTRSEVYTAALDPVTGYMTREEVRKLENLPPERARAQPSVEEMVTQAAPANGNGGPARVEADG